jgi:V/A-type H+-transporting ATPase subunit I
MKKVNVLALDRDIDALVAGLGTLRAIHLTASAKGPEGGLLQGSDRAAELERLHALGLRIERLAAVLHAGLDLEPPDAPEAFAESGEIEAGLDRVEPEVDGVVESQRVLSEEAETLRRRVEEVADFEGTPFSPAAIDGYSFVHFALGSISRERMKKVRAEVGRDVLLLTVRDVGRRQKVLVVAAKEGREALDAVLEKHGFTPEAVTERYPGKPDDVLAGARKRLAEIVKEDRALMQRLQSLGKTEGRLLRRFWRQLHVRRKMVAAYENLGRTQSTVLVSGWVPEAMVERFVGRVLDLTEHRAVIEIRDPKDLAGSEEPPTSLRHSWLTRPFALLVSGYGYPKYHEVEPTILMAISFLAMFGVMFGDVGQGAVLLAAGLLIRWRMTKPVYKDFTMLIVLCGASAVIFGFVYGSFFGKIGLIPALWGEPMDKVPELLLLSLAVGVAVISLGVVLNILNKFRVRDWAAAVFDRFGVVGIAFYWGALGLGARYMLSGQINMTLAMALLLGPLVLLFLKEPVQFVLTRGGIEDGERTSDMEHADVAAEHTGGFGGFLLAVVEGGVEVLEALLMYMANTASFVRVGAYAVVHAGLCLVIFSLMDAVSHSAGGLLWSALLLVGGNAIVIAMEGLVVTVQTLRLEYYEFFGKFFVGEGQAYRPFDLSPEG